MYFEDEKDIIDENSNLHIADDGTVSWEDILSDSSEGALEFINDSESESTEGSADVAGEPASISPEPADTAEPASEVEYITPEGESASATDEHAESGLSDDFDIDKQLAQVSFDDENSAGNEDFEMPAKTQKKSNLTTILLGLLVAVVVMGGIYYYFTTFQSSNQELVEPSEKTKMDNMTAEQMEERNNQEEEANAEEPDQTAEAQDAQPQEEAEIPVINDDNVDDLKPVVPEKKQVIAVTPTGRINPFLPLQKYLHVDIKNETIVQYDKVGIPTPPVKMGEQDQDTVKMLTISVSGIMYDKVKPSAIITLDENDYFVQKGDRLDDYKVIDIGVNYVTVAHGKNLYKASVGEEFKISSNFYGSADYIPKGQGGGRQYYSVSGEARPRPVKSEKLQNINEAPRENNVTDTGASAPKENIYVSDDDVVIKSK